MEHFYEGIPGWFDFQDIYSEMVRKAATGAHFVEVGAFLGRSTAFLATEIINSGKSIRLDVVDTFKGTSSTTAVLRACMGPAEIETMRQQFEKNVAPVRKALSVHSCSSLQAAQLFEDDSVAFVFIDADHAYEAVRADICAWLPKIRAHGFIGGHDYHRDWPGVIRAVDEVFGDRKEIRHVSWLVKKC